MITGNRVECEGPGKITSEGLNTTSEGQTAIFRSK